MSEPLLNRVEDGVIEPLKAAFQNKVRKVEALPADLDDAELFKRLLIATPGAYVSIGGGAPVGGKGGTSAQIDGRVGVFVVAGHANNRAARRRGDATAIGTHEMVEVAIVTLHGLTIPGVGTLSLIAVEKIFDGEIDNKGASIVSAVFEIPLIFPKQLDPALLGNFETFEAQYDIPPHEPQAQHRKWLDGDTSQSAPNTTDMVNPQQ